jgi:hypothetical protein
MKEPTRKREVYFKEISSTTNPLSSWDTKAAKVE